MSRIFFWDASETNIVKEIIYDFKECRYKCNNVCYNNRCSQLGKKCYKCKDFTKEINKVEPY